MAKLTKRKLCLLFGIALIFCAMLSFTACAAQDDSDTVSTDDTQSQEIIEQTPTDIIVVVDETPETEPVYFTVSYESNGGESVAAQTVVANSAITCITPGNEGYFFDGWFSDADFDTAWDFTTDTVASNITLYAKWQPLTYIITLDSDEGVIPNDTVSVEADYLAAYILPVPIKDNYTFIGWSYSETFLTDEFGNSINAYPYFDNITAVAIYELKEPETPENLFTEGDFSYSLNEEGNSYTVFANSELTVYPDTMLIPSAYNSKPVTIIADNAFKDWNTVTSIVIPDSVIIIGEGAFSGCNSVTEISLPFIGATRNNNETEASVFGYIFGSTQFTLATATNQIYKANDNTEYNTIYYIPDSLTTVNVTNADFVPTGAFSYCDNLQSINLNNEITTINTYAFAKCEMLNDINMPSGLLTINKFAFHYCQQLESLTLESTILIIEMYAFIYCDSLTITCNFPAENCTWELGWNYLDFSEERVTTVYKDIN